MNPFLTGKVAIVTGGGRGLGRAHCLELARRGAAVVVNDPGVGKDGTSTEERPADLVVEEIVTAGGRAVADHGSVTDWDTCEALVERAVEEFGRLDVVVNNAGIVRDRVIVNTSEQEWDAVLAVHLKGTFAVTRHACAYWRSQAKAGFPVAGRIVNTTSGAGLRGNVGQAAYGAAKAAIANLTVVTALEMRRYGVTANAISPLALTRISAGVFEADDDAARTRLDPAAASPVVAWLASDDAGWLTGQVLRIEGDTLLRMRGWQQVPGRYRARGELLDADEVGEAARMLWDVAPEGLVPVLEA